MKPIYITGTGVVSPQKTWDNSHFLEEVTGRETTCLHTLDPNYKDFVPSDMVRRMSRIIKMGITAAKICLDDACCRMPDAIITGTGLGCIEDTEKFLINMIRNKEEFLTPTSFIQSTHNTVSAQIALILKCHNYNFTYVHRGISFESALIDSAVRLCSDEYSSVLLGSMDEMTPNTFTILQRLGHYKRKPVNNTDLLKSTSRGSVAGEGSAFFLLRGRPGTKNYAAIEDMKTFHKPSKEELRYTIEAFLERNGRNPKGIDAVILGLNGDPANDNVYEDIRTGLFSSTPQVGFKHLCGEYNTASSFALWMAANMITRRHIPEITLLNNASVNRLDHILIFNHYRNLDHSLMLVSSV